MKKTLLTLCVSFGLSLFLLGNSFALSNEEATNISKELIKTEFKSLEIREAPLESFWEVVVEARQERIIF